MFFVLSLRFFPSSFFLFLASFLLFFLTAGGPFGTFRLSCLVCFLFWRFCNVFVMLVVKTGKSATRHAQKSVQQLSNATSHCLAGIEPAVGAAGCLMALVGSTVIAIFWAFPQVCFLY